MEYAQFETEYKRVSELIMNGRSGEILPVDITRLRALASQIDDEDDRELADLEVASIKDVLANYSSERPSELLMRARSIYAEADRNDGTDAERLARVEKGIDDLMRIENATPEEAGAIGSMEHVLRMLADALRSHVR